jgi:hypothetical protein
MPEYFAHSARYFFASFGLFVAVYSSISQSRASGRRDASRGSIYISRCFMPS